MSKLHEIQQALEALGVWKAIKKAAVSGGGGIVSGVSAISQFLNLADTPDSYEGQAQKIVRVKADETGLEFTAGGVGGGAWGSITGILSDQTDLQAALDGKVDENVAITAATKTKITYDAKGLVTAGADATTADVADSLNKRYVTDAQQTIIGNTAGTNTGDQTSIVGITGTKAQFDVAVTDGNFLYSGDITQYTNEMAQDAVGTILGDTATIDFIYDDVGNSITFNLKNTTVTAASYGSAAAVPTFTVDAQGRLSSAANTNIQIAESQVTGLVADLNGKQPLDATLTAFSTYNTDGILVQTAADTFAGRTVTGTASRISVVNGSGVSGNPTINIDSGYVGQASITTLGTITTGVWAGTDIAIADGGTGAGTAAAARTNLGLVAGGVGDIWVEKAGDTMTGSLTLPAVYGVTDLSISNNGNEDSSIYLSDVLISYAATEHTFSGKVGVGTATISAKLHILETTQQLRLGYNSSNYSGFTVGATGALTLAQTGAGGAINLTSSLASGNTTTAAFNFKTTTDLATADEVFQVGDSAADFFTIRGTGNVGIGTTAPAAELDVQDTVSIAASTNALRVYANHTTSGLGAGALSRAAEFRDRLTLNDTVTALSGGQGFLGIVEVIAGAGNVTNIYGAQLVVRHNGTGTGIIGNAYAAFISGGMLNASGVGGAVTNGYGVYVENITGTTNTPYAFYQVGTTNLNYFGGLIGIGQTAPTALLHIKAGTATASTAPIKLTSGTVNTTAEAGTVEFTTDNLFFTITTGAARKALILDDGARLTSGRVPFATTNGRLIDAAAMTFSTDTLTVTKLSLSGATLNTDVNLSYGIATTAMAITKNDVNTRTFSGIKLQATLNTGASNTNTTLNLIDVDTTNTAITGLTTHLMHLKYGGATQFRINSNGDVHSPGDFYTITDDAATAVFGSTSYLNGAYFNVTGKNYGTFPGKGSAEFVIGNDTGVDGVRSVFKLVTQDYAGGFSTKLTMIGSTGNVGIGTIAPDTKLHISATDGTGAITYDEESVTPSNPVSGTQCRTYVKADKFIIQFNDAGTIRYKYLDLTGTGVTWVHTTVAP